VNKLAKQSADNHAITHRYKSVLIMYRWMSYFQKLYFWSYLLHRPFSIIIIVMVVSIAVA